MLISKFGTKNADDMICGYEDVIGMKLPAQLTAFIRKYNGGETPGTSFRCGGISSDVRGFYGLGKVKYSLDKIKPFEQGGNDYLPVAFDSFGNNMVIDLCTGQIAFHDHENGKITLLSDDLKGFINNCNSKPISANAVKSVAQREQALIEKGRGHIITDALRDMWRVEIDKYETMNLENVSI